MERANIRPQTLVPVSYAHSPRASESNRSRGWQTARRGDHVVLDYLSAHKVAYVAAKLSSDRDPADSRRNCFYTRRLVAHRSKSRRNHSRHAEFLFAHQFPGCLAQNGKRTWRKQDTNNSMCRLYDNCVWVLRVYFKSKDVNVCKLKSSAYKYNSYTNRCGEDRSCRESGWRC